jgi:FkbM family methyltransferase
VPRTNRVPRLDLIEIVLLGSLVAGAVWGYTLLRWQIVPSPEAADYRRVYGPARNSEHGEEWFIRHFFQDRRGGFFLDVGANHYRDHSNTYYLETVLGWEGIAVEPLTDFEADYVRYRPKTRFRPFFVSDVSNELARMYVLDDHSLVSSGSGEFTSRYGDDAQAVDVPTITLNDLLDHEGVERVDFLSMDIELWEPKALAGFDIERFRPALVCIEAHPEVRQQLLDYFARHGYVLDGRYLRADVWNLYFRPLEEAD